MLQSGCMVPFALRLLLQINGVPYLPQRLHPGFQCRGSFVVSPRRPIILNRKPTPGANRIALAPNASNCRRR
jgi:hypothetical protein